MSLADPGSIIGGSVTISASASDDRSGVANGLIELGTAELDTHLRLRVRDQGTSTIDRSVFARRVQGSDSEGEGIGLSIAAELAVSLGGFMTMGDGTEVSFDLMLPKS